MYFAVKIEFYAQEINIRTTDMEHKKINFTYSLAWLLCKSESSNLLGMAYIKLNSQNVLAFNRIARKHHRFLDWHFIILVACVIILLISLSK
jgi:hypothetical protein